MDVFRLSDAFAYAAELHRSQYRKGGKVPYLAHLMGVTSIVMEQGGREHEVIAALLHDSVEDQGGLPILEEIRSRYGSEVAQIVETCSDSTSADKAPWKSRKMAYIERLSSASPSALLVSAADKLQNLRAILFDYRIHGESVWDRFSGGRTGTLWYYQTLSDLYMESGPPELAGEIRRTLDQLSQLIELEAI
jgi:GTP pyrophosphokinase